MELDIYQVDAFALHPFEGNPAAVIPLTGWLDDSLLQKIAEENNLSETAYIVPAGEHYELRWFTPVAEVDLCGHATLATAHVLFTHLNFSGNEVAFETRSGMLRVTRSDSGLSMDFPATLPQLIEPPAALLEGMDVVPVSVSAAFDYVVELQNADQVRELKPNLLLWSQLDLRGVLVTAPGDDVDFVSRCFFPAMGINEDPVTGSAHCEMAPYWAKKLNRNELVAKQLSARSGIVHCQVADDRVVLSGSACDYMRGVISI